MDGRLLDYGGKVVLITGAATGIGRAVALAFAGQGAKVAIGDRNSKAAETVRLIEDQGGEAAFIETDVSNATDVEEMVRRTVETFGGLHVAFNNAGVLPPLRPLADHEEEVFDLAIAVDLKGVFLSMKYEILHMMEHGGGAIVNTSSIAGTNGFGGLGAYVAAKHGVIGLTKAAAIDYAGYGIRVNALAPGLVETPMTAGLLGDPALRDSFLAGPLVGRAAQPEEMVGIVLYLCSPLASFATGQTFVVDGGQTAR